MPVNEETILPDGVRGVKTNIKAVVYCRGVSGSPSGGPQLQGESTEGRTPVPVDDVAACRAYETVEWVSIHRNPQSPEERHLDETSGGGVARSQSRTHQLDSVTDSPRCDGSLRLAKKKGLQARSMAHPSLEGNHAVKISYSPIVFIFHDTEIIRIHKADWLFLRHSLP